MEIYTLALWIVNSGRGGRGGRGGGGRGGRGGRGGLIRFQVFLWGGNASPPLETWIPGVPGFLPLDAGCFWPTPRPQRPPTHTHPFPPWPTPRPQTTHPLPQGGGGFWVVGGGAHCDCGTKPHEEDSTILGRWSAPPDPLWPCGPVAHPTPTDHPPTPTGGGGIRAVDGIRCDRHETPVLGFRADRHRRCGRDETPVVGFRSDRHRRCGRDETPVLGYWGFVPPRTAYIYIYIYIEIDI